MKNSKYIALFENDEELAFDDSFVNQLDVIKDGEKSYHILKDGKSVRVEIESYNEESKVFALRMNGKSIKLKLKEELDILIEQMGFKNVEEAAFKEVVAPMPGLVVKVLVKAGDEISKGASLVILEAMKMENVIKADGHAIIKEVLVKAGDKVDKNQVLINLV